MRPPALALLMLGALLAGALTAVCASAGGQHDLSARMTDRASLAGLLPSDAERLAGN